MTIKKLVMLVIFTLLFLSTAQAGRRNIDIVEVSHPQIVARGESFDVNVTVKNRGDYKENIAVFGEALNQFKESDMKSVESRDKEYFNISFTPRMKDSGSFKIELEAESDYSYDYRTVDVKISEMEGYFNLRPPEPDAGDRVRIKGKLDHTELGRGVRNLEAELYEGNRYLGTVETDRQGYFSAEYTPKRAGSHTLKLVKDTVILEKSFYVEPSVRIEKVSTTERKIQNQYAEACVRTNLNGVDDKAVLEVIADEPEEKTLKKADVYKDGQRVCFGLPTDIDGMNRVKAILETNDGKYSDEMVFNYMVESRRLDMSYDPDKVIEENGKFVVPVEIINRRQEEVRTWISLDTDLNIVKRDSPVKVPADSSKEVELEFKKEPGMHEVGIKLETDQDKFEDTIKFGDEGIQVITGMISAARKLGIAIIVLAGIVAIYFIGKRAFNPRPLEPRYG